MKLIYKKLDKEPASSFLVRRETSPYTLDDWHIHSELELIYFLEGRGTRYVGNSIGTFNEGELYLVGSHLPHLFKNEIITDEKAGNDSNADFIVVQFTPDFLGKEFYGFPETVRLKELFEKANMGLIFNGLESCLEG